MVPWQRSNPAVGRYSFLYSTGITVWWTLTAPAASSVARALYKRGLENRGLFRRKLLFFFLLIIVILISDSVRRIAEKNPPIFSFPAWWRILLSRVWNEKNLRWSDYFLNKFLPTDWLLLLMDAGRWCIILCFYSCTLIIIVFKVKWK